MSLMFPIRQCADDLGAGGQGQVPRAPLAHYSVSVDEQGVDVDGSGNGLIKTMICASRFMSEFIARRFVPHRYSL